MADQFATFTENAPTQSQQPQGLPQADIVSQSPHNYAALTATQKIQDWYPLQPNNPPTADKLWEFYDKAYNDSQDYQTKGLEARRQAQIDIGKQVSELMPQAQLAGQSVTSARALEQQAAAQQQAQWEQGRGATALAAAQPGGIAAG